MNKFLLTGAAITAITISVAGIIVAGGLIPAKAQNTPTHALVALGFVFNGYSSDANCHAAGDAITSNVNGGTFKPNYYCVPMTNTTSSLVAVGGGYSSSAF
jgi:hypothetical protein